MPLNRDQGQTTRWYQLCFVRTSPDSSDDSDIESVVLTPNTTWQELSPPSPPQPDREPQIDWHFPPPPPPPPQPDPEPQIDWRFPPSPPPPPLASAWDAIFNIHLPPSQSHEIEGYQSECTMDVMNGISRMRISEIDEHSHCPICMDEFKVDDQACQLPCNHSYCSECILRWLNNNKTCPVCRLHLNGCSSDIANVNHEIQSQPEIPPPASQTEFLLPPYSEGDNSDEGDYDSACDEFCDSHEDGASQSAPALLT